MYRIFLLPLEVVVVYLSPPWATPWDDLLLTN